MKIRNSQLNIYDIVENGMIANPDFGEGRMIPALVLNSTSDNGLEELIKIHYDSPPGDVVVRWQRPLIGMFDNKVWYLLIEFKQPIEFSFQIKFVLSNDYILINGIFKARGLYIDSGLKGDKISSKYKEMISIEVPDTNTDKLWENTLNGILKKKLRKESVPKKNMKEAIRNELKRMNEILLLRIPK